MHDAGYAEQAEKQLDIQCVRSLNCRCGFCLAVAAFMFFGGMLSQYAFFKYLYGEKTTSVPDSGKNSENG